MTEDDLARNRFFAMQGLRLAGIALILLGILALYGRLDWGRDVGIVLAVIGMVTAVFGPHRLARKWRTPRD